MTSQDQAEIAKVKNAARNIQRGLADVSSRARTLQRELDRVDSRIWAKPAYSRAKNDLSYKLRDLVRSIDQAKASVDALDRATW